MKTLKEQIEKTFEGLAPYVKKHFPDMQADAFRKAKKYDKESGGYDEETKAKELKKIMKIVKTLTDQSDFFKNLKID